MALPTPGTADTVLITGASSGIGVDLARELAGRGYGLTLAARRAGVLEELAASLRAEHRVQVDVRECDLTSDDARTDLVDSLLAPGARRLVGVCNNAGKASIGDVVDLDPDDEVGIVRLNALALHELTVRLARPLAEQGTGAILNVASVNGFQPVPGMATYSATKAFVISFSEALHVELRGTGVSCTTLSPGPTRTPIWARADAGVVEDAGPSFLWQDAAEVARAGVDGMVAGKRTVVPAAHNKLFAFGGRHASRTLLLPAIRTAGGRRLVRLLGG